MAATTAARPFTSGAAVGSSARPPRPGTSSGAAGAAAAAAAPAPAPSEQPAAEPFPPSIAQAEAVAEAEAEQRGAALEAWRRALLEVLEGVQRGSGPEAPPVEEVWHWLAGNERLARCLSFCEHAAVARVAHGFEADAQRGEIAGRWQAAVKELKRLHRECDWNARYLRVVEAPLQRLDGEDALRAGALASTVRGLLRSLQKIFCTSAYFKEERMAQLLRKILKSLVSKAGCHLVGLYEVARPPGGLGAAFRTAGQLRDGFQAFIENHFIGEGASGSTSPPRGRSSERRPATAPGLCADRFSSGALSSARRGDTARQGSTRRSDSTDLGWWRATARVSLEHAEHCQLLCQRLAEVLERWAQLRETVPQLSTADPELHRDVEAFDELYSGVKSGGSAADLLDLKRRMQAASMLQAVEERLAALITRAEAAGVVLPEVPVALEEVEEDDEGREAAAAAEVLTLSEGPAESACRPGSAAALIQENISSIQEDLQRFGSQLESRVGDLLSRRSAYNFVPPTRGGGPGAGPSAAAPSPWRCAEEEEAAERRAALEVARRASWYKEPPPVLPSGVPLIEVRHGITQRVIHSLPQRPHTAHPLFATAEAPKAEAGPRRPATAAAAVSVGAWVDAAIRRGPGGGGAATVKEEEPEDAEEPEEGEEVAEPSGQEGSAGAQAPEEPNAAAEMEGRPEEQQEEGDSDSDGLGPVPGLAMTWRVS